MVDQIQALHDRNKAKAKVRAEEDRLDLEKLRDTEAQDKEIDGRRFMSREGHLMNMAVSADIDQVGMTAWSKLTNEEAIWLGRALVRAAKHNQRRAK